MAKQQPAILNLHVLGETGLTLADIEDDLLADARLLYERTGSVMIGGANQVAIVQAAREELGLDLESQLQPEYIRQRVRHLLRLGLQVENAHHDNCN